MDGRELYVSLVIVITSFFVTIPIMWASSFHVPQIQSTPAEAVTTKFRLNQGGRIHEFAPICYHGEQGCTNAPLKLKPVQHPSFLFGQQVFHKKVLRTVKLVLELFPSLQNYCQRSTVQICYYFISSNKSTRGRFASSAPSPRLRYLL